MRILVVSDSHSNYKALESLLKIYPDMDLYLHCGDSEEDEFILDPFRSVRGNCDHYYSFPDHLLVPTPIGNIYIQHYPNVDYEELKRNNVKIFIHGHTHIRKDEIKHDIRVLNPGAITFSRDGHEGSYMILSILQNRVDVTHKAL